MKIKNTETALEEDGHKLTYADIIKVCMVSRQSSGLTLEEVRACLSIEDAIGAWSVGEEIEFSESEHQFLAAAIQSMRWAVVHRDIITFAEAFGVG